MQTWHKIVLPVYLAGALLCAGDALAQSQEPSETRTTVVDAEAGPCSADFVVRDASGKAVYDAKIEAEIQYGGFFSRRKLGVNVGTSAEGRARVEGLPERLRRPAEFRISHGTQIKYVPYEPLDNCHAQHEVILED